MLHRPLSLSVASSGRIRPRVMRPDERGRVTAVTALLVLATSITLLALWLGVVGMRALDHADALRVAQLRGGAAGATPLADDPAHRQRMQGRNALLGAGVLGVLLVVGVTGVAVRSIARLRLFDLRVNVLSRMDAQTGLPNRRAWDERLAHELAQSRRLGYPVTIAMIDPDHFRIYNERAGRAAGDVLLADIALAWSGGLRKGDLFVRYSGERFALLLPGCTAQQAAPLIERLRTMVPNGQTLSAGVACWHWRESSDELVARTHRAVELAKVNGRDRVEVSESPDPNVDRPSTVRQPRTVARTAATGVH